MRIRDTSGTQIEVLTNYAYLEVGVYSGSLPFSVPGDSRVVWDTITISHYETMLPLVMRNYGP